MDKIPSRSSRIPSQNDSRHDERMPILRPIKLSSLILFFALLTIAKENNSQSRFDILLNTSILRGAGALCLFHKFVSVVVFCGILPSTTFCFRVLVVKE